eukprot:4819670-Karenia_brevis.AAC.1
MVVQQLQQQSSSSSGRKEESDEKKKRVMLDEKRRMDKFGGEAAQFKRWMFNFGIVLGQVDGELAEEVRKLMSREDTKRFPDEWNPKYDFEVDRVVCNKYKTELYGVLVSLTSGEPLGILRGLQDTQFQFDGESQGSERQRLGSRSTSVGEESGRP